VKAEQSGWKGWLDKTVLIMGLGIKDGGVNSAKFAVDQGARVIVTDLSTEKILRHSMEALAGLPVEFHLDGHTEQDFLDADIIIKNPGIKPDHPLLVAARDNGAVIESPVTLFTDFVKKPYIGITGTKGKSLTTHLTAHLINYFDPPCIPAGNNCRSPLRDLQPPQPEFVLELSSWQLRDLAYKKCSPHIACWLNFFPDHLNHYNSLEEYFNDKAAITKFQTKEDYCVLPWNDTILRDLQTKAEKVYFSPTEQVPQGCYYKEGQFILKNSSSERVVLQKSDLPDCLQVSHYAANIAAAIMLCQLQLKTEVDFSKAIQDFPGLPHRFESFITWKNIHCVNDSAATTPESVCLALESVQQYPLVVIAGGGGDKNLDYDVMAETLITKAGKLILFDEDPASKKLLSNSVVRKFPGLEIVSTMEQAVAAGFEFLSGKGTLLLSPGCSGAPFFPDLFVRGENFKKAVLNFTGGNG